MTENENLAALLKSEFANQTITFRKKLAKVNNEIIHLGITGKKSSKYSVK